jgi:hypothetical protein
LSEFSKGHERGNSPVAPTLQARSTGSLTVNIVATYKLSRRGMANRQTCAL